MAASNQIVDRTRNFRARVALERDVLAIVNSAPDIPELLGLTDAAVRDWYERALPNSTGDKLERVRAILLTIARETGTITDQSRETLSQDEIGTVSRKKIEALRVGLQVLATKD